MKRGLILLGLLLSIYSQVYAQERTQGRDEASWVKDHPAAKVWLTEAQAQKLVDYISKKFDRPRTTVKFLDTKDESGRRAYILTKKHEMYCFINGQTALTIIHEMSHYNGAHGHGGLFQSYMIMLADAWEEYEKLES
jgi:hypothetical protein